MDFLNDVIGQQRTRSVINFYIEGQRTNGILPPILLSAQRGAGKTKIARIICENLVDIANQIKKPWIEVNGASVKKVKTFIDNIIIPHVSNEKQVTLFFDEFHAVSDEVKDWLLSVLQPNEHNRTFASWGGEEFEFDFSKFSFLAGTTNAEHLSKPLLSRFKRIELEPYTNGDLTKILKRTAKDVTFAENVESQISTVCRHSPRCTVQMAQDIVQYCAQNGNNSFGARQWGELKKVLNIYPMGLTVSEIEIMRFLSERGPQTLTAISAKLCLDASTVRRDLELFLLSENLIRIDGKRCITDEGTKVLDKIDKMA